MLNKHHAERNEVPTFSRVARVMARAGLAMTGAICATFVGAQLANVNQDLFDSAGFIAFMILLGMLAFYLGIDIPREGPPHRAIERTRTGRIEFLSAIGTFLAAFCALISVYAFVFDEDLRGGPGEIIGAAWMLGIIMLISAGVIGRSRPARKTATRGACRATHFTGLGAATRECRLEHEIDAQAAVNEENGPVQQR
jgi:peptidoglycan/LPS O-acetylase OafA/YrhL